MIVSTISFPPTVSGYYFVRCEDLDVTSFEQINIPTTVEPTATVEPTKRPTQPPVHPATHRRPSSEPTDNKSSAIHPSVQSALALVSSAAAVTVAVLALLIFFITSVRNAEEGWDMQVILIYRTLPTLV